MVQPRAISACPLVHMAHRIEGRANEVVLADESQWRRRRALQDAAVLLGVARAGEALLEASVNKVGVIPAMLENGPIRGRVTDEIAEAIADRRLPAIPPGRRWRRKPPGTAAFGAQLARCPAPNTDAPPT